MKTYASRSLLSVSLLLIALLGWTLNANATGGAFQVNASFAFQVNIYLTAGLSYTFETRNPSAGANPYLRLFYEGGGTLTEVAKDDNGGGAPNARIQIIPTVSRYYTLMMHATNSGATGTADVYFNNSLFFAHGEVGGAFITLGNLHMNDMVTTLPLARGPAFHSVFFLDTAGQLVRVLRSESNEVTQHVLSADVLTERLLISGAPLGSATGTGRMRVVVNDASLPGHDSDGDGLGRELETSIGTCSALSGIAGNFECGLATDPRDTDGDGLSDLEELLGQISKPPYQWLPRWGADPRHKDVFVEVDFNAQTDGQPDYRMSRATALALGRMFAFAETDGLRRLLNKQTLVNPDKLPGVRMHLDTGIDPPANATDFDFVTYGNWGGHSYVPAVCSAGTCQGAKAEDVWGTYFSSGRLGMFHYALGFIGSVGSAGHHLFAANLPIGGPAIDDMDGAAGFSHEFGHTLGLGHSSPESAEGDIDPNCKPNFPSVMNYGYMWRTNPDGSQFMDYSDGYGRVNLNNTALTEFGAIAGPASSESQRYLLQLRDFYGYRIDFSDGSVDWNRDGVWATKPVRAYSNENGVCEWTRYNRMSLSSAKTTRSPALVRLNDTTAAFYLTTSKRLAASRTTSDFNCPVAKTGCGTPLTPQTINGSWNSNIDAFDVMRIADGGSARYLVVFRKGSRLYEVALSSAFYSSSPVMLPSLTDAIDEVSLAGDDNHAYLMFKSYGSIPIFMRRTGGGWGYEEFVITTGGQFIAGIAADSTPALLQSTSGGVTTLYGLFPMRSTSSTSEGALKLYTYNFATSRWAPSWSIADEATAGRPSMAAVPMDAGSGIATRLYVAWMRRSPEGVTVVRQTMLIGTTSPFLPGGIQTSFRPASDHDNPWFYARGLDLLYEPGVDSNVRALIAPNTIGVSGEIQPEDLQLRPRADGISDYTFRNYNEWEYLGIDLCRILGRFNCRPWPF